MPEGGQQVKTCACHLCEAEWNAGELPIRPDGSYDCPGCGYTFWASKRESNEISYEDWREICITPEMPYCPDCKYGLVEYPEWAETREDTYDSGCKWICTLQKN